MVQNKKRIISLILMLTLLVSSLVIGAITASANGTTGTWTLVTDASTLKEGDQVIIAAKDYNYAMSTTQNGNNRGQAAITKNGNTLSDPSNTVAQFTLETGKKSGTFAFKADTGYIHAASSSSNYLRTETTLSENSSWSITIATDGTATVKAQGSYTRNVMQYNQSSKLFACYSSASQKAIVIYKWVESTSTDPSCEHTNKVAIGEEKDATCTEAGITAGEKCADCDETITAQETIDALGHNYVNGVCVRCDTEKPKEGNYYLQSTVNGTTYYWDGSASSGKGGLTTDINKAVKLTVEVNDNLTYVYYIDDNGTKQYVYVASNSNTAFKISSTATSIDLDSENGYLYSATYNRYVATYGTQDVRTYETKNIPGSSNNTYMIMTPAQTVCVHTPVDEGEVTAPTCTEDGFITHTCSKCGESYVVDGEKALDHSFDEGTVTKAATCTATGIKTCTCTRKECGATTTVVIPVIDHNLVNNVCSVCNYKVPTAKFELGENGSNASEATNALGKYSETVGDYTLTFSELTKVYEAKDGLGNGCLKLGTGSAQGSFSFTVPNDIISVTIMVSGRQTKTAIVVVNGITYEIATTSDSGEYTAITVDTTTNKTVSCATAKNGDEYRAMVDSIMFYACNHEYDNACDSDCNVCGAEREITHNYALESTEVAQAATCVTNKFVYAKCACGDVSTTVKIEVTGTAGHAITPVDAKDATCTEDGYTAHKACSKCDYTEGKEVIPATGHATEVEYWAYNNKLYLVPVCGCLTEKVLVDTTNALPVTNEEDLVFLVTHGFNVVLDADINLTKTLDIEGAIVTIDLNGKTLKADWESDDLVEVIHVHDASHLTIVGDGNVISGGQYKAATNSVISCRVYSQLTIKGGNYYSASYGDVIFCETSSIVYIEGGHFEAATDYLGTWYVLDIDETETYNRGKFIVTGGTFVNFNPANHTNDGKDYTNKVAPGYITEKVGNTYVVSEFEAPATEKVTISNPFTLSEDIVLNSELVVTNGAVIDLNGKTLTTKAAIVFSGQIKGAGSLVVDKNAEGKSQFSVLNGATLTEVPVKLSETETTETFVFRAVEDQQRVDVGVNNEGVTTHSFVFKPSFAMKDVMTNAELFGTDGTYNNNISFGIIVSRTNANGTQNSEIIPVPDTLVYGTNKAFKMTLTGVTDDYEYSIRVVVIYDETIVVYQGEIAYLNKKETN